MRHRPACERRCSYLVVLENASRPADQLHDLAAYLSDIAASDFEVIVVDASSPEHLEENRRVLRWVCRHTAAKPQHVTGFGKIDVLRAAIDLASCDKVIVADEHVRYSPEALDDVTALLEMHEVVEPQDYFDPMPWWGGIEAGRILVHRSISPIPDRGSTFGFRKRSVSGLRSLDHAALAHDYVRRLASQGAEVFTSMQLFVRRMPPAFSDWIRELPRRAEEEFRMPATAVLFFMLIPSLIAVTLLGGARMAGTIAAGIAFASIGLALRGRIGAGRFFPWRACFFAPVWILQRSVSIYCGLLWRVSRGGEPRRIPITVRAGGEQVASGK